MNGHLKNLLCSSHRPVFIGIYYFVESSRNFAFCYTTFNFLDNFPMGPGLPMALHNRFKNKQTNK